MLIKLKNVWNRLPDSVKRVIHTGWQVAIPVLFTHLELAKSSSDVKSAIVIAGAAGLAAIKAAIINLNS